MSEEYYVNDVQPLGCLECGELKSHFMYHDGNWHCVECGAKHE